GLVFNDHRAPELFPGRGGDQAGQAIRPTARRIGHHQPDRLVRIRLLGRAERWERSQGDGGGGSQNDATFHWDMSPGSTSYSLHARRVERSTKGSARNVQPADKWARFLSGATPCATIAHHSSPLLEHEIP